MSNNKPTIDQIMRLHRLTVKSFFDMQSLTNAEKEEVNELERQFGMLDCLEIMNDEIEDAKLDFKRVDNKNYELTKEIEKLQLENKVLKEQLKLAESQINDLKQYVDELNKAVYQENGED